MRLIRRASSVFALAIAAQLAPESRAASLIPEEITRVRDPFKRPALSRGKSTPRSELEFFAVDKFKLVGVMTGPQKLKAMLQGPNGKTYFVSVNMKIGTRKGVIRKITSDAVHVREMVMNVLGQEESVDSEIRLIDAGKDGLSDAGTAKIGAAVPSSSFSNGAGMGAGAGAGMGAGAGAGTGMGAGMGAGTGGVGGAGAAGFTGATAADSKPAH